VHSRRSNTKKVVECEEVDRIRRRVQNEGGHALVRYGCWRGGEACLGRWPERRWHESGGQAKFNIEEFASGMGEKA
jgi:hypothetical protein